MIKVVALACRGTLVDWNGAIESVAYELARRNGESPLDRGAMLRRRVEALSDGSGLVHGFERLARERSYRAATDGLEMFHDVIAAARPRPGAYEAVALALGNGRRVVAVSQDDSAAALTSLFGGVFEDVVAHCTQIDAEPESILYVSSARWRRADARSAGIHAVAPHALAQALSAYSVPATVAIP